MFRFLCTIFFVAVASGAGFTATADCYGGVSGSVPNQVEDHGSLSCSAVPVSATPTNGSADAYVNNSVFATDTSTGATFFSLQMTRLNHSGEAVARDGRVSGGRFVSVITFQQTLTTLGDVRPGLISYTLHPGPYGNGGCCAHDYQEWLVGPYSGYSTGRGGNGIQGDGTFLLPFVLGSPFNVSMSSRANSDEYAATVYGTASLEFRLYEADGQTPVEFANAIVNTPEPGMNTFTGVSILGLFIRRFQLTRRV